MLPEFLQRTPEQLREEEARQQKLRDLHSRARQTPAEQQYARAILVEPTIRMNLMQLEKGSEAYKQTMLQLAENLSEQGRFKEAITTATRYADEVTLDQYRSLQAALEADDNETCDCPDDKYRNKDVPGSFIAGEVFSEKHNKVMPIVRCGKCGFSNIRTPPANLTNVEK